MPLQMRTFVLGGAASGKSAYAEAICEATGAPLTYIATAQAFDDEMRSKIAEHRARRNDTWHTIEAPLDIAPCLAGRDADEVVLIDCATLWLSNLLLAEADISAAVDAFIDALAACPASIVVVSNEVGQGVVPETSLGRAFRNAQGRLNQRLAAECSTVVQVIAGLPRALKGDLP